MDEQRAPETTSEPTGDDTEEVVIPAAVPDPPLTTANRWLHILQSVTDGAIAHRDLHDLLHQLLGHVRTELEADNAAILLVKDDGTHLAVYAASGAGEDVTGQVQIPIGFGVAGMIVQTGKPVITDDLAQVAVEHPRLRAQARSSVGVPLRAANRVIGVLQVESARPRHFTEDEGQLLQSIAGHVALTIEYAHLYEAERAARHEAEVVSLQLKTLQAVSDVALEYARLSDLLRALLEHVQHMLQVDNVAILLPTPDGQDLTLYSVRGAEEAVMGKVRVPIGQGVAGTIAATRKPLFVDNLASVPVVNAFLKEHYHSLLGVPLLAGERLVGVIHVDSAKPRRFTDEESQLLQMIAGRIAIAIDRAHGYESVEQRRIDAERRVAVLQEATERMDEFLSIASHELRTPLTTLTMNIQMLASWMLDERGRQADESDAAFTARAIRAMRPLLKRSNQSVRRLNHLVSDLLDTARIGANHLDIQLAHMDLVALVHEVVEEQRDAYADHVVRLVTEPHTPITIEGDYVRIGQVLTNFTSNAFKFSQSEQPVTITVEVVGDHARVSVRDEGVGIPQAELSHIWERFYRVEGVEHQSGSRVGLGLGLYICRDIIERHGGQVGVESQLGEGSTFWFSLPLTRSGHGK